MHSGTKKINKKTKENWQKTYFFFLLNKCESMDIEKNKNSFNHYKYIEEKKICIDILFFIKKKY